MGVKTQVKRAVSTGTEILAWVSFLVGTVGGAAAAATWIGSLIGAPFHWWGWAQVLLKVILFVGTVGMILDAANDLKPDRFAVWMAILLPSLAAATSGKLAATIRQAADWLLAQVSPSLTGWIGTSSKTVIAIVCIAVALAMAKRVNKRASREQEADF